MGITAMPDNGRPVGPEERPENNPSLEREGRGEDRPLAEDLALPVIVEPGVDYATPPGWNWRDVDASQPNAAVFHISHSEITRVLVDTLRSEDCSPGSNMVIKDEIPIVVLDSLDKYWAGEAKSRLRLNGIRVPVEADTVAEAKRALADDLAAQLRLLMMLRSSRQHQLAPQLEDNLKMLISLMEPRQAQEGGG